MNPARRRVYARHLYWWRKPGDAGGRIVVGSQRPLCRQWTDRRDTGRDRADAHAVSAHRVEIVDITSRMIGNALSLR